MIGQFGSNGLFVTGAGLENICDKSLSKIIDQKSGIRQISEHYHFQIFSKSKPGKIRNNFKSTRLKKAPINVKNEPSFNEDILLL